MNMMNWAVLVSDLLAQSPVLLVYLIAVVLCAVWWRRAPAAAMMAMAGTAILLLTSIAVSFLQFYYININMRGNTSAVSLGQIVYWTAIAASVLRAVGFGLVLAAVFIGRPQIVARSGFEVHPFEQPTPPMPR